MDESEPATTAPAGAEFGAADAARLLLHPTADDDKYSRGVVGMRTGSTRYPGAAVLGVEAAARSGVGMVRFVGEPEVARAVLARRPEVVVGEGRVQAWVIGSGTDPRHREASDREALLALLAGEVPVVVDAGALELISASSTSHERHAPVIATPHRRELVSLASALGVGGESDDDVVLARRVSSALGIVVLAKGATTRVVTPDGRIRLVRAGTPWLATAGTGDVLGGVIGAIVAAACAGRPGSATRSDAGIGLAGLADLTCAAAVLHGVAARLAAGASVGHPRARESDAGESPHPIVALDVAEALPRAWAMLASSAVAQSDLHTIP